MKLTSRHALILSSLLLGFLSWNALTNQTFFSVDTGLRFILIQSLVEQQWHSFAIDYPLRPLDPLYRHVPYYTAYLVINEQIFLSVTPYFPLLSSWSYAAMGRDGLPLVPLLGSLLTAWATYRLAHLSNLPQPWLLYIGTLFATPVGFYALTVWDHSLGAACAMLGMYGLAHGLHHHQPRTALLGGIALGFSTGQRPELYLFACAAGLSMLMVSRLNWQLNRAAALGGLLGVLPLWGLQQLWFGNFLAPVVARRTFLFNYGNLDEYLFHGRTSGGPLLERGRLLTLVESGDPLTFLATLLTAAGVISLIIILRRQRWHSKLLLYGSVALSGMGYLLFAVVAWQKPLTGLLTTMPLIAFSLTFVQPPAREQQRLYRFVLGSALLFLMLMIMLWPSFGGQQWGARYLLPLYPLLIYLAWQNYLTLQQQMRRPMRQPLRYSFIMLISLSMLIQLLGMRFLYAYQAKQQPTLALVRELPAGYVLTNNPFIATQMAAVTDKQFIYVSHSQELLEEMLTKLATAGTEQVSVLFAPELPLSVPQQLNGYQLKPIAPQIYHINPIIEE